MRIGVGWRAPKLKMNWQCIKIDEDESSAEGNTEAGYQIIIGYTDAEGGKDLDGG